MRQHYFLTNDIDSVEHISDDLHQLNIDDSHIHVVGTDVNAIEEHHVHLARAIDKTDIACASERGALMGVLIAIFFVWGTVIHQPFGIEFSLIPQTTVAILMVGICAYWGGVFGAYADNYRISKFRNAIQQGMFLLMVDTKKSQTGTLRDMMRERHPEASWMGEDSTIANPFHA